MPYVQSPQQVIAIIDPGAFPGAISSQWDFFTKAAQNVVSEYQFPDQFDYALALYTAHLMTIALPSNAVNGANAATPIHTMKVGGVSIGYQSFPSTKTNTSGSADFLGQSKWGRLYQNLTITSSATTATVLVT